MDTVAQASGFRMRVTRVGFEASEAGHVHELEEHMETRKGNGCEATERRCTQSRSWSSTGKRWRSATRGGSTLRSRSDLLRHIDRDHHVHRALTIAFVVIRTFRSLSTLISFLFHLLSRDPPLLLPSYPLIIRLSLPY